MTKGVANGEPNYSKLWREHKAKFPTTHVSKHTFYKRCTISDYRTIEQAINTPSLGNGGDITSKGIERRKLLANKKDNETIQTCKAMMCSGTNYD